MRQLRSAGAALLLLILVIGIPLALAATIGNPLRSWPDLIAGDVSDRVIIDILAAAAYLAWAQFAVATAVELVSAVRRTPMPRPIPGIFTGQQQLARALVTAALVLVPTVGSTVAPTAQALAALPQQTAPTPTVAMALHTPADDRTDGSAGWPSYTVTAEGPSTFWDLADATLGSGDRWRELWQANQGRTQTDGTVLQSASALRPGWTVLVPRLPEGTPAPEEAPGDRQPADTEVTVRPGDTLSGISVDHGVRDWRAIWPANDGRPQPGGERLTDPDEIEPGWTVVIPADSGTAPGAAEDPVRVAAGDTLSGIAADRGIPLEELVAANLDRPQPDGKTLTDPDLIEPGWTIELPAPETAERDAASDAGAQRPASTPGPAAPEPAAPAPVAPASAAPEPAPVPAAPQPQPSSPGGEIIPTEPPPAATDRPSGTADGPAASAPAEGSGQPITPAAGGATTTTSAADAAHDTVDDAVGGDRAGWPAWAVIAGGGTLLAGSALTVLRRHRRSQMRRRRPGRFIGTTPGDLLDTERALLAAGGDGWDRTTWMDRALRSLVTAPGREGLPDVLALRLGEDAMELVLRRPKEPATDPWTVTGGGTRWHLERSARLPFDDADRPFHYAPYPALVSVGQTDEGDTWLLDLEAAKYVPVTGSLAVAGDFARFLATELATNTWSEIMSVTVCGLGPELSDLDPQRLRVDTDLTAAAGRLRRQLRDVTDPARDQEAAVLGGRLDGVDGDLWAPEVLIVSGSAADSDEVSSTVDRLLASDTRVACAVVACRGDNTDDRGGVAVTVDGSGGLRIPALGLDLRAARASAADSADLAALLDHARTAEDRPMPRPPAGHPLHGVTDDAGLIADLLPARRTDIHKIGTEQIDITSLLPEPVDTYRDATAATAEDVTVLAPDVPADTAARLGDTVTGLDRDLADWHNPASARPKVTLLGPVHVAARGDLPDGHPRQPWNTEMIAYLATREQGATVEELGAAMWPGEADVTGKSKLRNAVYIARKWLGPNPATGRDHLPSQKGAQAATHRLEGVLVDADLFVRLRVRAQARGGRDGISDLRAALDLVTGPPFDRRRPGGYGWLAGTALDYQYQAMIADVAHTVATHHLAAGEPAQAEWAARVALLAGSQEDTPLLDLVAACQQAGDTAAADQHVRDIMANHDAVVEEDLPKRTYEILLHKGWLPTPAAPH